MKPTSYLRASHPRQHWARSVREQRGRRKPRVSVSPLLPAGRLREGPLTAPGLSFLTGQRQGLGDVIFCVVSNRWVANPESVRRLPALRRREASLPPPRSPDLRQTLGSDPSATCSGVWGDTCSFPVNPLPKCRASLQLATRLATSNHLSTTAKAELITGRGSRELPLLSTCATRRTRPSRAPCQAQRP